MDRFYVVSEDFQSGQIPSGRGGEVLVRQVLNVQEMLFKTEVIWPIIFRS